jgi:hypothetical protein
MNVLHHPVAGEEQTLVSKRKNGRIVADAQADAPAARFQNSPEFFD